MDENIDLNEKYLKYFSLKKIYERNKDLLSSTNDFVKYKIFTRDEEFILIDPYEYLKTMNNCFYKFQLPNEILELIIEKKFNIEIYQNNLFTTLVLLHKIPISESYWKEIEKKEEIEEDLDYLDYKDYYY
jgi:hypothetical protein